MRRGALASLRASMTLSLGLASTLAAADEPVVAASMQCERAVQPGRMKCTAEAHVTGNRTIAWADLVIVELPELAAALKGRIGPADATAHDPARTTWAFGLVAKKAGQGDARAKVRIVVCEPPPDPDAGAPVCAPQTLDVKTTLQVGPS